MFKFFLTSSLFLCVGAGAADSSDFLKEFKLSDVKFVVEERDGFFAYLQDGYSEYFFTDEMPVSISQVQDGLSVLRVVDRKNKKCSNGYYIIEHGSEFQMISEYLPTCAEHNSDIVYVDDSGTLHIEVKGVGAGKIRSISYKEGKIVNAITSV